MATTTLTPLTMATTTQPFTETLSLKQTKTLVADLCRHFYTLGWVSGTGGSVSIKVHDDSIPRPQQSLVMSPSGVQKERMVPEDMYVVSNNEVVLSSPSPKPFPHKPPKCTDCAPIFMKVHEMRNAGAVIHSHGMESCLVTMIRPFSKEFRIKAYPKATGVLVRNHGVFIWGDSWISAKTQAECYHYLFDAAIKLHQFGLDWSSPSHGPVRKVKGIQCHARTAKRAAKLGALNKDNEFESSRCCILLDIEGTTTPISFVTDVLFPYARDNVRKHLTATYDTEETKDDIMLLRAQVEDDLKQGISGAQPIPPDDAGKEEVIASLVANVEAMIRADRKITSLKQLQGHIWRTGFQSNELEGAVFEDVPVALEKWSASGIKVYIYSSGSRESQKLIFGKSNYGDLRKYLCGFFDTNIGNKKESRSYFEISQSVGVDSPSEILFLTDVYQEAVAAKAAGLEVVVSVRPGNGPLPENHGFKTIESFLEI